MFYGIDPIKWGIDPMGKNKGLLTLVRGFLTGKRSVSDRNVVQDLTMGRPLRAYIRPIKKDRSRTAFFI